MRLPTGQTALTATYQTLITDYLTSSNHISVPSEHPLPSPYHSLLQTIVHLYYHHHHHLTIIDTNRPKTTINMAINTTLPMNASNIELVNSQHVGAAMYSSTSDTKQDRSRDDPPSPPPQPPPSPASWGRLLSVSFDALAAGAY